MTETLVVIVVALIAIAATTLLGPRLRIAPPLILVAIGVGASFLPAIGGVQLGAAPIEPAWILEGLLPPLLYSSAVSIPTMNFRREFGAISGLSVLLVVGTALVLGVFFALVIPGLGFAWGVALGAVISPTDAVATSIVKRTSVSQRVIAMLEGESLLNDATALVLLRTAIVAVAAGFSFWGALGTFAYSVAVAAVIGWLAGWLTLEVRRRIRVPTVNTVISFTVPFLASVPATLLNASGLVAAVVAGLVVGILAPRLLSPQSRLSDGENWRTIELVLEGVVFLTMGLQIRGIVVSTEEAHAGVGPAILIAVGALVLTIVLRAAFVGPLLGVLRLRRRGIDSLQQRIEGMQEQLSTPEGEQKTLEQMSRGPVRRRGPRDLDYFRRRLVQGLATIDYFRRQPLGWRDGTAVIWAGMRGAVTVAAAQTLPEDTPQRSMLVLIGFAVAALSLVVQGGTVGPLLRTIAPVVDEEAAKTRQADEVKRLFELIRSAAESVPGKPNEIAPTPESFQAARGYRIAQLVAQRNALLDARDNGTFDADVLDDALANIDASQIDVELRGRLIG